MRALWMGLLLTASLGVYADENLYAKNYHAQGATGLASQQAAPNTELFSGKNKEEDNIRMLERGYDLMGASRFNAGDISPKEAQAYGQQIKADAVLVYVRKAGPASAGSKMEFIKQAVKKGQELTEADMKGAENYNYYASYWAKLPQPILGVHVIKLQRKNALGDVVPETGLKVVAVIEDSPAAKAGLQRGDVLLKVNDTAVEKPEELSQLVRGLQGQQVAIVYERQEAPSAAQVQLNTR